MSSQRGNSTRKRTQKHKNAFGFKNDMHGVSDRMKEVNNLYVSNVCQRCKECIEWKIKYKKYKPLTVPSKCVKCFGKKVKYAYHIVCTECALQHGVCAKCNKEKEVLGEPEQDPHAKQREENNLKDEMKFMRERERRTLLRQLERGEKAQGDARGRGDNGGRGGSGDDDENSFDSDLEDFEGEDEDYEDEDEE